MFEVCFFFFSKGWSSQAISHLASRPRSQAPWANGREKPKRLGVGRSGHKRLATTVGPPSMPPFPGLNKVILIDMFEHYAQQKD